MLRGGRALGLVLHLLHVPGLLAGDAEPLVVPDVPFLSQTQAMCGGAALAMVLRYWGDDAVRAEDFTALLDAGRTGITTEALTGAAQLRGRAFAIQSGPDEVAAHLQRGRPVIALAEVAPGRLHYVVLLAWRQRRVLLHDPAIGPFRVVEEAAWLRSWRATGNWALLVVPAATATDVVVAPADSLVPLTRRPADDACVRWVDAAVDEAQAGQVDAARTQLQAAAAWCPTRAAPLRELAALEFQAGAWAAAAALASQAVAREADDAHAWRLLAVSRFVGGQPAAALMAWNRVAEPRFDALRPSGFERIPVRVMVAYLGLEGGTVLTPATVRQAQRRILALPGLRAARVGYVPVGGGRAQLEAAVVERPAVSGLRSVLLDAAVHAARERSLGAEVLALTTRGEALRAFARWQPQRARGELTASAPRALGLPGLVSVATLWDEQSYLPVAGVEAPTRERRRRAALAVEDWWRANLWARVELGVDAWRDGGRYVSLGTELERRLASDRVGVSAGGDGWWASGGAPFSAGFARVRARASSGDGPNLSAEVSYDVVSSRAPRALWPGAGVGRDRRLRAHTLLHGGVLGGPSFGRELLAASAEVDAPLASPGPVAVRGALFVDGARVLAPARGAWLVDVGVAVSLRPPTSRSSLRLELATPWGALHPRLSVGWRAEWTAHSGRD